MKSRAGSRVTGGGEDGSNDGCGNDKENKSNG